MNSDAIEALASIGSRSKTVVIDSPPRGGVKRKKGVTRRHIVEESQSEYADDSKMEANQSQIEEEVSADLDEISSFSDGKQNGGDLSFIPPTIGDPRLRAVCRLIREACEEHEKKIEEAKGQPVPPISLGEIAKKVNRNPVIVLEHSYVRDPNNKLRYVPPYSLNVGKKMYGKPLERKDSAKSDSAFFIPFVPLPRFQQKSVDGSGLTNKHPLFKFVTKLPPYANFDDQIYFVTSEARACQFSFSSSFTEAEVRRVCLMEPPVDLLNSDAIDRKKVFTTLRLFVLRSMLQNEVPRNVFLQIITSRKLEDHFEKAVQLMEESEPPKENTNAQSHSRDAMYSVGHSLPSNHPYHPLRMAREAYLAEAAAHAPSPHNLPYKHALPPAGVLMPPPSTTVATTNPSKNPQWPVPSMGIYPADRFVIDTDVDEKSLIIDQAQKKKKMVVKKLESKSSVEFADRMNLLFDDNICVDADNLQTATENLYKTFFESAYDTTTKTYKPHNTDARFFMNCFKPLSPTKKDVYAHACAVERKEFQKLRRMNLSVLGEPLLPLAVSRLEKFFDLREENLRVEEKNQQIKQHADSSKKLASGQGKTAYYYQYVPIYLLDLSAPVSERRIRRLNICEMEQFNCMVNDNERRIDGCVLMTYHIIPSLVSLEQMSLLEQREIENILFVVQSLRPVEKDTTASGTNGGSLFDNLPEFDMADDEFDQSSHLFRDYDPTVNKSLDDFLSNPRPTKPKKSGEKK